MSDDDFTINNVDLAWSLAVCYGNDYPMFGVRQNHFRHSGGLYPFEPLVSSKFESRNDLDLTSLISTLIRSSAYDTTG